MAIYAISDLHLAISIDKPMDIFGPGWSDYMDRLKAAWNTRISQADHVIIPGDISWATYLEQAEEDFRFIDGLPGTKIISKGNHDYWWTTRNKLEKYLEGKNISTIRFMHNNSFDVEGTALCGTRGWKCPGDDGFSQEDRKIFNRELQRLELSLKSIQGTPERIIAALHYPPFNAKKESSEFVDLMVDFGVKSCIYGHLHGEGFKNAVEGTVKGIEFRLVSADFLKFDPVRLV